ncbi:MAG: T9SS type A sorting domain-containing protein [Saprospiraceae bacterium]|nr:T9SS type A sorting domain-containing protein [Saprospiraceae bacterium]
MTISYKLISLLLIASAILQSRMADAQSKYDYTWIMGYDYTTDTAQGGYADAAEGMIIDFNQKPQTITLHPIPYEMLSINVISHPQTGQLQYYTNGCSIINANHEVMDNGHDINKSLYHSYYCNNGTDSFHSDFNAMVSLPAPDRENVYYLIHRRRNIERPSYTDILYSVIDLNQNEGLGRVSEKNELIHKAKEMALGFQTACKHSNGRDWWIIAWERYQPKYHVFLLDETGIKYYHTKITGPAGPDSAGQATFSPDGKYHIWYDLNSGVYVYDFDRNTGELSYPRSMVINEPYEYGRGGVSFSPNSRFAYLSARDSLYQLDMEAGSLADGLMLIDTINYITRFGIPLNFSNSMLAPDCRIYISTGFSWETMHIIHHPDEKGTACGLEKRALTFPFPNSNSAIPNMVHYRMDETSVCDPTLVSVFPQEWYNHKITVYPNPATDFIHIHTPKSGRIMISSISGNVRIETPSTAGETSINIVELPLGIYFMQYMTTEGNRFSTKFIKI